MAAKTKSQLATAVLKELRLVRRSGGAPSAADSVHVQDKYSGLLKELRARELAFWDEDQIPEHVFEIMTEVMAGRCSKGLGVEYDAGDAFTRLLVVCAKPDTGEPTRATFF